MIAINKVMINYIIRFSQIVNSLHKLLNKFERPINKQSLGLHTSYSGKQQAITIIITINILTNYIIINRSSKTLSNNMINNNITCILKQMIQIEDHQ